MSDVSIKTKQVDLSSTTNKSSGAIDIGGRLSTANVGQSSNTYTKPEQDKKLTRQNEIINLANEFKVSVEDIHNFIKKALGHSIEKFYELKDEEFNKICAKTIPTILDILNRNDSKIPTQKRLDYISKNFGELLQNGNTIDEATNFFENYEDNGLFQILKVKFPSLLKQYNSAKDVPESTLEECIRKIFVEHKQNENQNNSKNVGKSLNMFKNLLTRTSDEDYKVIYNAFVKVASKEDDKFAGLVTLVEKFKNPEEFEKFIQKDLGVLCAKYNLDEDKMQQILRSIAKTAKETGLDSKELLIKLIDQFEPKNVYNKLIEKQKNGEELTQEEYKDINNYNKFIRIKDKQRNGEQLSEEETKFLNDFENDFEQKKKNLQGAIVAAVAGENPEDIKEIINIAEQYGINRDYIIQQIIKFTQKFDDYKIDTKILDEATEGAYSQALAQYNEKETKSETTVGLPQKVSEEEFSQSEEKLPTLKAQVVEAKQEPIIVEKEPQSAKIAFLEDASTKKSEALKNFDVFIYALAKGRLKMKEAGENFDKACQSVQFKVLSYIQREKNNRLDIVNSCHNTELANIAVNKFNFTPEQIEKLKVSIGRKQVMINNYEERNQSS